MHSLIHKYLKHKYVFFLNRQRFYIETKKYFGKIDFQTDTATGLEGLFRSFPKAILQNE